MPVIKTWSIIKRAAPKEAAAIIRAITVVVIRVVERAIEIIVVITLRQCTFAL